jgi:hypothetical protein
MIATYVFGLTLMSKSCESSKGIVGAHIPGGAGKCFSPKIGHALKQSIAESHDTRKGFS